MTAPELMTADEKMAIGMRLNEREWRIWLKHNWKPLHQSLAQISDRRVQYALNDNSGYLRNMGPAASGVYFLFLEDSLQYVGKSTNICQRLPRHYSEMNFLWNNFSWIEMPDECAEEVEHFYIYAFNPAHNVRKLVRGELMRRLVEGKDR